MPNTNSPHGLKPTMRNIFGGPIETQEFTKLAAEATAIFRYDAVCVVTGGKIKPGRDTAFIGVSLDYGKVSTLTTHRVVLAPSAVFEAQDDDATTGLVLADQGKNADLTTATAGNAATLISGHMIDQSTAATTNTLDVQLHRLHEAADNAVGPYARFELSFNKHFWINGRTGV